MPAVSVIIPVFNGAAQLGGAIGSVRAQSLVDFEVIVVDDGSSDTSAEVAQQCGADVQVLRQPNRGPAAARNAGCAIAQGSYLAFLDADDRWAPDKLESTAPLLDNDPGAVLVYSDATPVDEAGQPCGESYVGKLSSAPSMTDLLTRYWPILPSAAVMRRDAFQRAGGFAEEFRTYEDSLLWLRMRELGEFRYVPRKLVKYRAETGAARMEKYLRDQQAFIAQVDRRYGRAARELIRTTRQAYATALSHDGLIALRAGDKRRARELFARALRDRPSNVRAALRWMRTFMPLRFAQSLSGGGRA